jgi:hypothetical protein
MRVDEMRYAQKQLVSNTREGYDGGYKSYVLVVGGR